MNDFDPVRRRRDHLLVLLWALLFAKCFILEYCIAAYEVPVNSLVYVWGLSLFMATAASIVYVNLTCEAQGGIAIRTRSGRVWVACLALVLVLVLSSLVFGWIGLAPLTVVVSVLFAIAYAAQYLYHREKSAMCCAAGWCLCVGMLLQMSSPAVLLLFGISLIALAAFPSFLVYLRLRHLASGIMPG
ncbi:MAG: hypothetical protein ACPGIC_06470 [Opitutales bacterium]